MLLTGRRLSSHEPFSVWEERLGEAILIQDSTRQLALTLELAEARALRDALNEAFEQLLHSERRRDALRRFQILRARLATLADQARQLPGNEDDESDA